MGGEDRERREYLGPERRRPIILDAALALFAEGGFADASMSAIATRAGTTKPVLYDCFPDGKQEIYLTLLARERDRFLEHMRTVLGGIRGKPLWQALHEGISAFLDYAELNAPGFRVLFGPPGTADPVISAGASGVRDTIVGMMAGGAADVAGVDPVMNDLFGRIIVGVAEQLARWWATDPSIERDVAVTAVVAWMMRGFDGVLPDEGERSV